MEDALRKSASQIGLLTGENNDLRVFISNSMDKVKQKLQFFTVLVCYAVLTSRMLVSNDACE